MKRRAFLRCLAVLPLVPFLHALAPKSLADVQAASFLKKLHREPRFPNGSPVYHHQYNTGPSEWIQAHGVICRSAGKLQLIPITTGRFTA